MPAFLEWIYDTSFLWLLIGGSMVAIGYAYYKNEKIEDQKQRGKQ